MSLKYTLFQLHILNIISHSCISNAVSFSLHNNQNQRNSHSHSVDKKEIYYQLVINNHVGHKSYNLDIFSNKECGIPSFRPKLSSKIIISYALSFYSNLSINKVKIDSRGTELMPM